MYICFRSLLAALHFNYNVKREPVIGGLRVHYPKYKYGEATVKDVKGPQNFGTNYKLISSFNFRTNL